MAESKRLLYVSYIFGMGFDIAIVYRGKGFSWKSIVQLLLSALLVALLWYCGVVAGVLHTVCGVLTLTKDPQLLLSTHPDPWLTTMYKEYITTASPSTPGFFDLWHDCSDIRVYTLHIPFSVVLTIKVAGRHPIVRFPPPGISTAPPILSSSPTPSSAPPSASTATLRHRYSDCMNNQYLESQTPQSNTHGTSTHLLRPPHPLLRTHPQTRQDILPRETKTSVSAARGPCPQQSALLTFAFSSHGEHARRLPTRG